MHHVDIAVEYRKSWTQLLPIKLALSLAFIACSMKSGELFFMQSKKAGGDLGTRLTLKGWDTASGTLIGWDYHTTGWDTITTKQLSENPSSFPW